MPDLQRVEIDGKIEKIEVPDGVDVGEFLASAVAAIRADRAKPKAQAQNAAPRPLQGSLNAPVPVDPFRDGLKVQKPAQGNKPPKPIPAGFGVIGGQDLLPEARDKKPAPRAEIPKGEKPGVKGPILPSWKRQFEDQKRRDQANAPSYRAMTDAEAEKMPRRGKGESESSYQQRLKQSIETADAGNRTVAEQLAHLIGSGLDPEAMTATNERMGGLGSLLLGPLAGLSDLRLLNESEKRQLSPAQKFGASLNVGLTMAPGLTHAAGEGVVGALKSAPAKKLAGAVAQGFDQATKSRADRRLEGHVATALRQALGEDVPQFDLPAHGDLVSPGEMPGATFRKPTGKAGLTAGQRAAADASPAGHMTTAETLGPDLEASLKSLGIEVPEPRATGQAVPDKGLEPTNVPKAPEPSPKPTPAATGNVEPTAGTPGAKEPWQMTRDEAKALPEGQIAGTKTKGKDIELWATDGVLGEARGQLDKGANGHNRLTIGWISSPFVDNPKKLPKRVVASRENGFKGYGTRLLRSIIDSHLGVGDEISVHAPSAQSLPLFEKAVRDGILDLAGIESGPYHVYTVKKTPHRLAIEQALKDGKPVPPEVLADYPDLAAKYKPTGPTLSDAVANPTGKAQGVTPENFARNPLQTKAPEPSPKPTPAATGNVAPTAGTSGAKEPWQMTIRDYTGHEPTSEVRRTDLGNAHRTAVEQAFKQGKDVPGKVLADYPWLAADKAIKPYVDNLPNLSDKELKAELEKAGAELNAHRGLYGNQTFFEKQNRFSALGNEADARASGVRLTQSQYFDRWLNKTIDEKDRPKFLADQEAVGNVRKQTDANHRSLVAQALKDGKPVPPEVLADYPDLAAKYGKPKAGPTLSEAVQSGRTGAETRRVGAEDFKPKPTEPMQGPSQATGLANQQQDREALQGILDKVEPAKGKGAKDWHEIGKKKVESGEINPYQLAEDVGNGDVELTGERVGALLEGKRRLELDVNNAKPGAEYEAAKQRLQDYVEQVQQGKGRWSDVGRALQAGTTVDEGNFAQVIEHARRSGAELNPKQEAEIRRLAEQVKSKDEQLAAAQKIIEDQQASMTAQNVARAARRLKTGDVQKARDAARARFVKASAANTFVNDEQMAAWWDLAKTYVQKGDTPDSLIERIRKDLGDQLPDYITDADMKAAMALGGKPQQAAKRARTEIEKEIAKLRREAKVQTGVRDSELIPQIQKRIADLQDQLDTGQYRLPKARAAMYGPEVEKLQAQRDVLAAQVRAGIEAAKPKTLGQKVGSVLSIPKTLRASVDLSAPGRQGWLLSLANPEKVPAAFGSQIKAMLSEEGAAKAGRQIAERPNAVNGVYKRAGLEMTDYATGLGKHEEVFASNLLDRWTKGNPFRASDRAYSGYLNRIRADVFDKMAAALGDSPKPDDLKAIANYINVATGRQKYANQKVEGLIQGLGSVMWAPRLAASRMEYLAGKPLYSGGSAKAKVLIAKEYGKVLAGTAAMLGLAKAGGADVELDPRSSDFLKIKVGDTRIDALAGLTQWAVFASRMATGEVKTLSGKVRKTGEYASPAETGTLIQRFGRSRLNPVVGTAWDLREKKDFAGNPVTPGSAAKNLLGPLSATDLVEGLMKDGWHEDDAIGLLNFFGIGVNTYDKRGP